VETSGSEASSEPPPQVRRSEPVPRRAGSSLRAVARAVQALSEPTTPAAVTALLSRAVREATAASLVLPCVAEAGSEAVVVRDVDGDAALVAELTARLGAPPVGTRVALGPATRARAREHGLWLGSPFADAAAEPARATPSDLVSALGGVVGAGELWSVALEAGDALLGVLVVVRPVDAPPLDPDPVRILASVGASALARWTAERERAASEAQLRAIVEEIRDVLWQTTADLVFTYVSPSVEDLLGHPPSQIVGQSLFALLTDAGRTVVEDRLLQLDEEPGPSRLRRLELPMVHRLGHVVWAEVAAVALRGPDGRRVGYQGITRDISERRQAEQDRVELAAQRHQSMKMEAIGRLAGGIAHDFNNLLMGILGNLELVTGDLPGDHPAAAALADAQLAAESAAALTRQLLSFSRKQMIQPRLIEPNQAVEGLRTLVNRLIGEDVVVEWSLEPDAGKVRIDPGQLEQILVNLLVNARDALPQGGTVRVSTRHVTFAAAARPPGAERLRYLLLSVSDDGSGMDEATRARVFEPFFTTKPQGRGTGLGLATTYGAVRQAGGFIEVDSAPGHGATFRVYLPLDEESLPPDEPRPLDIRPPSVPVTVLLVEDEDPVRGVTHRILERLGYTVVAASSGAQALELAAEPGVRIDVLMTDVVMPRMSGVELAERIAAQRPEMRVLFTSGHPAEVLARDVLARGGRAFLGKPFTPRALAERLHSLRNTPS
jgi:two-component system cell cycle sensor histidine kinase/response regulator CckA